MVHGLLFYQTGAITKAIKYYKKIYKYECFLWFPKKIFRVFPSFYKQIISLESQLIPAVRGATVLGTIPTLIHIPNCGWLACFFHRMEDMRHVYIQTQLCVCVRVCGFPWTLYSPPTFPMVRSSCHPTVWHRCCSLMFIYHQYPQSSLFFCFLHSRMFACVLGPSTQALVVIGCKAENTCHIFLSI